jgi:hypothetical protein
MGPCEVESRVESCRRGFSPDSDAFDKGMRFDGVIVGVIDAGMPVPPTLIHRG